MKSKNIAVFCGMGNSESPKLNEAAFVLGSSIAQNQYNLLTAGSRLGLVGSVINGYASYEYHQGLYGIMPALCKKDKIEHPLIPKANFTWADNVHQSILTFQSRCDYAIFLAGGFGTLTELMSFLMYTQLGLIHKPIILINMNNFWTPLLKQFQNMVDTMLLQKKDLEHLHVTLCIEDCISIINQWAVN